jgi:WD40-like Beta Propeller Repeat
MTLNVLRQNASVHRCELMPSFPLRRWLVLAVTSVALVMPVVGRPKSVGAATTGSSACRAFDGIVQRRTRVGHRGLVNLSRAELGQYFDHQTGLLAEAARGSSGALRASLQHEIALTKAASLVVAADWGDKNGNAAVADAESAGYFSVFDYLLRGGVTLLDGSHTPWGKYAVLVDDNREALALQCRDLLPNERTLSSATPTDVPPGTVVFAAGSALVTAPSTGGPIRQLLRLDDSTVIAELVAAPDTGTLAFMAIKKSNDATRTWLAAADGTGAHPIAGDPGGGWCPAWNPDGTTTVVPYNRGPHDGALGFFTGDALASRLRVDMAVGCPAYLQPDQLVVNFGSGNDGDPSLWTMSTTKNDRRPFLSISGCSLNGPVPSPDRTLIAVRATCVDPARTGLYIVPAATAAPRQILGGHIGDVAWSPDGTWVVYTHTPIAIATSNSELGLFVAKADGSEFMEINPGPVTSAAWRAS